MAGVHSNSSVHTLSNNSMSDHSEQLSLISLESPQFFESFDDSFIKRLATTQDFYVENSADSVLVKSGFQDYQGILQGLDELKGEKERSSWALTTAKGSLVDGQKTGKKKSIEGFYQNTFGMPGKFFCKNCEQEMVSIVKYLPTEEGFWDSIGKLFKLRCCAEKSKHPDIVHICPQCSSILARITSIS